MESYTQPIGEIKTRASDKVISYQSIKGKYPKRKKEKKEMVYVSIARASSVDKAVETTYPVYGYGEYLKCVEAKTVDEIREIFRTAEPINLTEGKRIGIMRTDVGIKHYIPLDTNLTAITIEFDQVTLSKCDKVHGIVGSKFIVDTGKEVRSLYANATFFCVGE